MAAARGGPAEAGGRLPARATRGKRMGALMADEEADEAFWGQEALREDGADEEYEAESEVEDVVDSDFDEARGARGGQGAAQQRALLSSSVPWRDTALKPGALPLISPRRRRTSQTMRTWRWRTTASGACGAGYSRAVRWRPAREPGGA